MFGTCCKEKVANKVTPCTGPRQPGAPMSVRRVAHPQRTSWTDSGDRFVATHTRGSWRWGQLRVRDAAFWGSFADCLEMVKARHPQVAQDMMTGFRSQRSGCLSSVTGAVNRLLEVGVHVPEWQEIADGLRPEDLGFAEWEPCEGRGWQRHASATVHEQHREQVVWPHLSLAERALVRSQSGPLASVPFTALPIHRISRMDPEPFRVLLLRRLRMPLPLNVRACRCGRPLDVLGHHRAACSRVGELGKRGFAAESAVAQICREGGA